jgi:hypothetical protein
MDDCLAGAGAGRRRAFLDLARFGRELEGSRACAGSSGSFMDGFVGDLIDLDDLTEPWLRRCDFLRMGGEDRGEGCLGLGNLDSSRSESLALLTERRTCNVSSGLGRRSWVSGKKAGVYLPPTGVSGGGGVTVMDSGDTGIGRLALEAPGVEGTVSGEVTGDSTISIW